MLLPTIALAQESSNLIPCVGAPCTLANFSTLLANLVIFLTKLALGMALIALVYGAFKMITSGGSSGEVGKAKGIIYDALWGIGIAYASYIIVKALMSGLKGIG